MRYINLAIFVFLSIIYLSFSSQIKFSTNFIEIFFSQESLKLFDTAKKFGLSDEIYIAKKGFDANSQKELKNIAKELRKIPEISKVEIDSKISPKIKSYLTKNYYLLSDFNSSKDIDIQKKVQGIHESIYKQVMYEPINVYDPLELFTLKQAKKQTNLKLKNYGYMIKVKTSVNTSDASSARVVYDKINRVLESHSNTIAYAPFFFLVENSAFIRDDAQKVMMIATLLLVVLYFFVLKNYRLFLNTIFAIGSSILSAILVTFVVFESVSILAIVFGVSITTISIDYMFHYYFHKKFGFERKVFFGFLTTVGVFTIFNFIKIELFSQLALFSLVSLCVAYVIFTFLFSHLGITFEKIKINNLKNSSFRPFYIVLISVLLFGYSYVNLQFDNDLKNLDYNNEKLLKISKKFSDSLEKNNYRGVIIEATSKESLLQKYEKTFETYPDMLGIGKFVFSEKKCQEKLREFKEYDFQKLKRNIFLSAKKVGFKEGTFSTAYSGIDDLKCNMKTPNELKFKIIKDDNSYFTMALIDKEKLKESQLFKVLDLKKTLSSDTKQMKNKLVKFMIISTLFIVGVLFFLAGQQILYPLMYVMFPMSVTLFIITLLGSINIMHIFALVILIALSIDYGIYMYRSDTLSETKMAIKFALLSTFFGFGVLIFSKTVAMNSIGLVISIGIGSIFFLLYGKIAR